MCICLLFKLLKTGGKLYSSTLYRATTKEARTQAAAASGIYLGILGKPRHRQVVGTLLLSLQIALNWGQQPNRQRIKDHGAASASGILGILGAELT